MEVVVDDKDKNKNRKKEYGAQKPRYEPKSNGKRNGGNEYKRCGGVKFISGRGDEKPEKAEKPEEKPVEEQKPTAKVILRLDVKEVVISGEDPKK